jgi:hypothetical protein
MKTIVCSLQEQNWEDDGGDHDPFVVQVSDTEFADLTKDDEIVDSAVADDLRDRGIPLTAPVTIDWVGTIWYKF